MKKRILALVLSVVLIVGSVFTAYAAPDTPDADTENTDAAVADVAAGEVVETIVSENPEDPEATETFTFVKAASNDRFILAYDEATTFVSLTDKQTGEVWYSNPPIALGTDPYTEGIANTGIRSVLHLRYTNESMQKKETNSYSGSVMKKAASVTVIENGLRVDYNFKDVKVTIPVQYVLTESGMAASILYNEIDASESKNTINTMDFLTYFGAAGEEDEGYLVIPDGSGAIVEFNNQKNADGIRYAKEFYGTDMAQVIETDIVTSRSETVNLPVFGMVKNGNGMLAEVTSGAEAATLNAATSGNRLVGGYNVVYTTATLRISYEIPLMGQVSSDTSIALYNATDPVADETYTVEYHFTDGKDDTYMTLAAAYRETLIERGWLAQDTIANEFYVDFYGAVSKKKSFVGIVYNARQTLTSFGQAQEILADLKAGGVTEISANYLNFSNDFFKGDIEVTLDPSGSLGGTKDLDALVAYAGENNLTVGVSADFVTLPGNGHGFSTTKDTADVINIAPIKVHPFSLNGNTMDLTKKPYYLVKGDTYAQGTDQIVAAMGETGYTALYFDAEAVQLYSDLAPEGLQRGALVDVQSAEFDKLIQAGASITMSNPNAYLFAYAADIVDIPVCSSKELLFDGDIPFLQAILRGVKNFGGESMNITDVSDESFLRHVEYGTNMKYALINAESEALLNTDHTFLYSATYKNFAEQIKARYAEYAKYSEAVGDAKMVNHSRKDNVAVVTYDNGVKVIVNYTNKAVTVDGAAVEAMSFAIV